MLSSITVILLNHQTKPTIYKTNENKKDEKIIYNYTKFKFALHIGIHRACKEKEYWKVCIIAESLVSMEAIEMAPIKGPSKPNNIITIILYKYNLQVLKKFISGK